MRYILIVGGVILVGLALVLPLPTYELPALRPGEAPQFEARLIFGGDMMFDRYIRQISETVGGDYVFSCITPTLLTADAVIANLEGPITHFPSKSISTTDGDDGHYTFTFPPETGTLLARHNIIAVNTGNNHTFDFGEEGARQTKEYLTRADVAYFDEYTPLELTLEGVPFTFITYNEFSRQDSNAMIYHSVASIKEAREKGRVPVVYTHWGEEYSPVNDRQQTLARTFVDEGAALIVGSHPHVVQEVERYQDASIYYSLGNFIFDQYFSEEVTNGLLLSVTFTADGVKTIQEIPIKLHPDGRTCPHTSFSIERSQ